jgi:hypothetical protein
MDSPLSELEGRRKQVLMEMSKLETCAGDPSRKLTAGVEKPPVGANRKGKRATGPFTPIQPKWKERLERCS